jgi:hypothetical protein
VSKKVNAVITRGGKSIRDPPYPNHAGKVIEPQEAEGLSAQENTKEPKKKTAPQEFVDTSFLLFPLHNLKTAVDEQMIPKIHVNMMRTSLLWIQTTHLTWICKDQSLELVHVA